MKTKRKVQYERRAEVIKALAHPSRILIVEALADQELSVGDLTEMVGADISTVSKHLSILKGVGLVEVDKRGQHVFYSVSCGCFTNFFECVDQLNHSRMKVLKEVLV